MKKKVIIIGAGGYIARNMAYVISNQTDTYELKLYGTKENHVDKLTPYYQVNVLNKAEISAIDFDCDIVFVFTGKTGSANGFEEYDAFIDINEVALLNILNEYRRQKSRAKIVFPSTRLVYKGREGELKEDAEKEFKTIYAMNKYSCENYLEMFHRVYDIRYCIFRICIPYGTLAEGASSYGTAEFMLSKAKNGQNIMLYGGGKVRRTLTHIEDLCNMMLAGAANDACINDVYNIGGENYSLAEMAAKIAKRFEIETEDVAWPELAEKIESGDTVFDGTKLQNIIKYEFRHKFAEWVNRD